MTSTFKITLPLIQQITSWIGLFFELSIFFLWLNHEVLHGDNLVQELIALLLDISILGTWSAVGVLVLFSSNLKIIISEDKVNIFYLTSLKRTMNRKLVEFYAAPYYRWTKFYIYDIEKFQLISFDKELKSKKFISYLKENNQIMIHDNLDSLSTYLEKKHPGYKQGVAGYKTY